MITIQRVYDSEKIRDPYRVLVDRLWPRGISKEKASWDEWMKDVAPSEELRKWFNHEPDKWDQFKGSYLRELRQKVNELKKLKQLEKDHGHLTMVYAAKDEKRNNAVVLQELLKNKLSFTSPCHD